MKTSLKAVNLKEEYADSVLRKCAEEFGILIDDKAKINDFRIQLKRQKSVLAPFTKYDVWLLEGIREINGKCNDCVLLLCMTFNAAPVITDADNVITKEEHGETFRHLNFTLVRKTKDGKKFFTVK